MARTPVIAEATPVGVLSALLRHPTLAKFCDKARPAELAAEARRATHSFIDFRARTLAYRLRHQDLRESGPAITPVAAMPDKSRT
jgi:hypothetical protein